MCKSTFSRIAIVFSMLKSHVATIDNDGSTSRPWTCSDSIGNCHRNDIERVGVNVSVGHCRLRFGRLNAMGRFSCDSHVGVERLLPE